MTDFDVVIIGAGPSGLATALNIARTGELKILIIDSGRNYKKRFCPVDHGNLCSGCHGVCNVASGFGGAIHYGDGLKLSTFPSGRRLEEKLYPNAEYLMNTGLKTLFPELTKDRFNNCTNTLGKFKVKKYPVIELNSLDVKIAIENIYKEITNHNNIKYQPDTEVTLLENRNNQYFELTTHSLRLPTPGLKIKSKYVVVGVGRRGYNWWHNHIEKLKLSHNKPTISIGLRFETPPGILRPAAKLHPDLKISSYVDEMKVKTFCFCAGEGGGRIKFIDYGTHVLLDGHIQPDGKSLSENFALLIQLRDKNGHPRTIEWINSNLINDYRNLRPERPGKPVIQWYPDFKNKVITKADVTQVYNTAGIERQITDIDVANISSIIENETHRSFCKTLEDILTTINPSSIPEEIQQKVVVTALELEGIWDEIILNKNMESSLTNLYVVGDSTGLAQGVLQAASSGVAAAESIIFKESLK